MIVPRNSLQSAVVVVEGPVAAPALPAAVPAATLVVFGCTGTVPKPVVLGSTGAVPVVDL